MIAFSQSRATQPSLILSVCLCLYPPIRLSVYVSAIARLFLCPSFLPFSFRPTSIPSTMTMASPSNYPFTYTKSFRSQKTKPRLANILSATYLSDIGWRSPPSIIKRKFITALAKIAKSSKLPIVKRKTHDPATVRSSPYRKTPSSFPFLCRLARNRTPNRPFTCQLRPTSQPVASKNSSERSLPDIARRTTLIRRRSFRASKDLSCRPFLCFHSGFRLGDDLYRQRRRRLGFGCEISSDFTFTKIQYSGCPINTHLVQAFAMRPYGSGHAHTRPPPIIDPSALQWTRRPIGVPARSVT